MMYGTHNKTIERFYSELFEKKKLDITSETDEFILTTTTEDLVKYYSKEIMRPLEFDLTRDETIEHKKFIKTIRAQDREWGYREQGDLKIECESIVVIIPVKPHRDLSTFLHLRPNRISLSGDHDFSVHNNNLIIHFETLGYGFRLENEEIVEKVKRLKEVVLKHIADKNAEIAAQSSLLESKLTRFVDERKQKLDADKIRISQLVKMINIPLARKADDVIKTIEVNQKPFIQRVKPTPQKEEYLLDRQKVLDIIRLIDNQCRQFEKAPKTYNKFDEPNLRDLILSNLNSIFEGRATGETFNNKGKTDIYLNIDKGNILVCECKFYGGEKLYHQTIDQLLGYLTWRQNYGIMITFCKQKNFSKILSDADATIKSHQHFEKDFQKLDAAHYISKNTLPGDDYRHVEIHHLYYNLFV